MSKLSPFIFSNSPSGITAVRKERDEIMQDKHFIDDMEVAFPNGKYVEQCEEPPRIRFREMDKYCKQVGKEPLELTKAEMDQFRY
jgi:hypothetical protein